MYLRPGSLFRQFLVEEKGTGIRDTGRKETVFRGTGRILVGVLSDAKTSEIQRWKELQHPITHTIVQQGGPVLAKPGDRLVHGGRYFYVQGVDDPSMLGAFAHYQVEERSDRVDSKGRG